VQFWCAGESSSEDEAAYDEDDENAENNWRNDYPDDDPMYFERLHLDDSYSSDDGEHCEFYEFDLCHFTFLTFTCVYYPLLHQSFVHNSKLTRGVATNLF